MTKKLIMMHLDLQKTLLMISGVILMYMLTALQPSIAQTPTLQEMWKIIQEQQETIADLKAKIKDIEADNKANQNAIDATVEAIEESSTLASSSGGGASNFGGYGELHYNNREGDDQIDLHRFVLFFSHRFTDNVHFFSELEVEHALAGEGQPGEVELEQAWIEIDINEHHHLRAGVDILPIGIINYTHEPNRFYGVERPRVESEIIPATWWEAGIGLNGELAAGWNYDAVFHSGLNSTNRIRSGRQKVAEANADHPAVTGRLRYTATPGLEIGISAQYQSDISAGVNDNSATLIESHIDWKHRSGFGLRALYADWDLDRPLIAGENDKQYGYYIEPAFRFDPDGLFGAIGIFARWSELVYARDTKRDEAHTHLGINYWPIDNIVFKFDWLNIDNNHNSTSEDSWNLGLGYEF